MHPWWLHSSCSTVGSQNVILTCPGLSPCNYATYCHSYLCNITSIPMFATAMDKSTWRPWKAWLTKVRGMRRRNRRGSPAFCQRWDHSNHFVVQWVSYMQAKFYLSLCSITGGIFLWAEMKMSALICVCFCCAVCQPQQSGWAHSKEEHFVSDCR